MKLFLTSAGLSDSIRQEFLSFLSKKPQELTVAFIPTASHPEEDKSYIERARKQIQELGMKLFEVDLVDENEDSLKEKLSTADIIYVQGGNTFYLLKYVRQSGFDKVTKDLLHQGKIYMGVSAGSYIACPTIEMATWKHQDRNRVDITDFTALNLVPFLISAHYTNEYHTIIEKAVKTTTYPVIALNDEQAIIYENGKYRIIGDGEKITFNGFKEN